MSETLLTFKELDKKIEEYKENVTQRTALLILKSGAKPLKERGIPKRTATLIVNKAKVSEEALAQIFEQEDDAELYTHHDDISKALGKVIEICFEDE